jgi:predicted ATP-grasp superfamily ATP-dependent carboligase|tara:strand:+ start:494 stop:628 length:135 start_codon:yes stop_codon:yes gene_type:complete
MTHGEKMALLGKINMLYEMAIEISNKINKLNRQLKEAEEDNGTS